MTQLEKEVLCYFFTHVTVGVLHIAHSNPINAARWSDAVRVAWIIVKLPLILKKCWNNTDKDQNR